MRVLGVSLPIVEVDLNQPRSLRLAQEKKAANNPAARRLGADEQPNRHLIKVQFGEGARIAQKKEKIGNSVMSAHQSEFNL